jgi:hypothetical protein
VLAFAYRDPPRGEPVTVEQAVRVARPKGWSARLGPAIILCWGIFPSGLLRHPMLEQGARPRVVNATLTGWREQDLGSLAVPEQMPLG